MSFFRRLQSPDPEDKPPAPFSYRMGARDRFIPMNMREGRPARLIQSAIILTRWAKGNVQDVDSFLAFESAFSLIADDLDEVFCPHNTIISIFYTSFRKKELAQFRWFIRGVQFPRQFSDPIAHQERHGAALGIFPQLLEDETDLRRYLLHCQADEIGMQVGIDFLDLPARRIAYHDMDDYVTHFASHGWDREEEESNDATSLQYPTTPHLPIQDALPEPNSRSPDHRPQTMPPALLALLNAINVHRTVDRAGEPSSHTINPQATSTRSSRLNNSPNEDNKSDTIYGDATADPMRRNAYDW
jgi:hypothetical protein